MEEYWPKRLGQDKAADGAPAPAPSDKSSSAAPSTSAAARHTAAADTLEDEYDRTRAERIKRSVLSGGWRTELQRYLDDPAADVKKTTDTVEWWSVSHKNLILTWS